MSQIVFFAMTGNFIRFLANLHAANYEFQGRKCNEKAYKSQNEVGSVELSKRCGEQL